MNAQAAALAAAASSALILLREDIEDVAILTLNRPQARNSLSEAMLEALGDALTAIAHDRASSSSVDPPAHSDDVTRCFVRLTNLAACPLDRLSRYEGALWRQACQTLFALQCLSRRRPWERLRRR